MKNNKHIQISIPHTCTQSWDEMKPSANGKFCDHCQHTVVDFTTWCDAALYNFFAKNNDHVCGRYLESQLDRPISILYQPHSRLYRLTIALGLTLMVASAENLHAQNHAPLTTQADTSRNRSNAASQYGAISGHVIDESGEPVIIAAIQVFQNGILKGGAVPDFEGNYVIKPLAAGTYDVVITSMLFDTLTLKSITVTNEYFTLPIQTMKPNHRKPPSEINIILGYKKPLVAPIKY